MGKVLHLDPSLLGHWATVCLCQRPSVVTREAPCSRPQVGMRWKESSGHSEVGAGHQGPSGISPGGRQVCSAGPGPWASREGVWARNGLLLEADGGLALLVADAEHLPVTSGLSLFFPLFPESGLDPKVTGISFPSRPTWQREHALSGPAQATPPSLTPPGVPLPPLTIAWGGPPHGPSI